jgi:hypothetical protein
MRRRQRAQEVREVAGQRVKLKPHGICFEPHAGEPRPRECVLAFLDVLLGGAALV